MDLASGSLSTQSALSNAAGPVRNAALMVGSLQVDDGRDINTKRTYAEEGSVLRLQ